MSFITVCCPEQIVVDSMLSAGITGCTAVIYLDLCNISFCFNFLLLYSLFQLICILLLGFYCLHISSLPFVAFCNQYLYFYISFSLLFFFNSFIFFL